MTGSKWLLKFSVLACLSAILVTGCKSRSTQAIEKPSNKPPTSIATSKPELTAAQEKQKEARRKREERIRAQEELKQAKVAAAQAVLNTLEVDFGFSGIGLSCPKESSIRPGEKCWFHVFVKNHGSKPISGLRFVVQPAEYLEVNYALYNPYGGAKPISLLKGAFNRLTRTGMLIHTKYPGSSDDVTPRPINPLDSSYYEGEVAGWGHGEWRTSSESALRSCLVLSKTLTPGRDVTFTGYLIIKGQKLPIGTAIAHVMYPE